ncbi:hypothetical protein A2U01_0024995, partial [Trifolium medium]|nr:hypothetical protein [Trifolium medium]
HRAAQPPFLRTRFLPPIQVSDLVLRFMRRCQAHTNKEKGTAIAGAKPLFAVTRRRQVDCGGGEGWEKWIGGGGEVKEGDCGGEDCCWEILWC